MSANGWTTNSKITIISAKIDPLVDRAPEPLECAEGSANDCRVQDHQHPDDRGNDRFGILDRGGHDGDPIRYSAAWWIQNGRMARSPIACKLSLRTRNGPERELRAVADRCNR